MSHFKLRSPQAEKAAALRALANRTDFPAESAAARSKANDLIERYDLSEKDLEEYEVHPLICFLYGRKP